MQVSSRKPRSCDTFAVLPSGTEGCVIFGKNSDRPYDEVQEVVYVPATDHKDGTKLKCTYIEIDQVAHTHAVILSKPSWMWGAEMGSNEFGVCIGNEAVWTKVSIDPTERLLGMDLLRLGLERASTALEAVHVVTGLLETYGQGGNCSESEDDFTYHNTYLIADATEVWILETVDVLWAAERVTSGCRNISNDLSIGTKFDLCSTGLVEELVKRKLWKLEYGPVHFRRALNFGANDDDDDGGDYRYQSGKRLLSTLSSSKNFQLTDMFKVLRHKESGICMSHGSFVSTGSQVSVLWSRDSGKRCVHWFTATPDPSRSVFKPFVFVPKVETSLMVVSPIPANGSKDRRHSLYRIHEERKWNQKIQSQVEKFQLSIVDRAMTLSDESYLGMLFKNAVEEEIKLYEQ